MARIRTVKPDFFIDDDIAALDPLARLLFIGLWCLADKGGRLEDKPQRIKIQILPYDDCPIDSFLDDLANGGFIVRYEVEGQKLIQIKSFCKHQVVHHTEKDSILPLNNGDTPVKYPLNNSDTPVASPVGKERKGKERKGKERKGKEHSIGPSPENEPEYPPFDSVSEKPPVAKKAIPPPIEDVIAYCQERKNKVDPEKFMAHYKSNGWMVGKNKMVDWKAAVITWEKNDGVNGNGKEDQRPTSAPGKSGNDPFAVCPKCRKEVLKTDLTKSGCLKCEQVSTVGREALGRINAIMGISQVGA